MEEVVIRTGVTVGEGETDATVGAIDVDDLFAIDAPGVILIFATDDTVADGIADGLRTGLQY